jgi:hypothetical protein
LFTGAVNVTDADATPLVAPPIVGGSGGPTGITAFDAADEKLVPMPFVAVTEHVYVLPFVNPVTSIGLVVPSAVPLTPPFDDTHDAVKFVIAPAPPPLAGGVNATVTNALPGVAVPIVGASGTVAAGIAMFDNAEGLLWPTAFVAITKHL